MKPQDVLALCREKNVKAVDLRFMDFPGLWQHFTIPTNKLDEDVFENGLGFDGSSIRGWQAINESDTRSEEHTSELQSQSNLVCRLLLEKKNNSSTSRSQPH